MTVLQYFTELASKLNLTDKQVEGVNSSRDAIVKALQSYPGIHLHDKGSFYTGSYSRNTMIRPLDDIDLYVPINCAKHDLNAPPQQVMQFFLEALKKSFPTTPMKIDSSFIAVNFSDKRFEIVPVVGSKDNDDMYAIPGVGRKQWEMCFPNVPDKLIIEADKRNGNLFVPLIKMIKQWVRKNGLRNRLKSFHIEMLTDIIFKKYRIESYPLGLYIWLGGVHHLLTSNTQPFIGEPEGCGYVDDYLFKNKLLLDLFKTRLGKSFQNAHIALDVWEKGHEPRATVLFRSILGPVSP